VKPDCDVLVVGAGITGLGAAYQLARRGLTYLVLEAGDDVGGVWRTHRWHGARCDSDFIKYSFSFKPFLSDQCLHGRARIQAYLREVAEEFDILPRIRFGTRVLSASFHSAHGVWEVRTSRGVLRARFLFNGNGYFSSPHLPRFRDEERFAGEIVHTAALDDARSFAGKRVVVVGSGSTAVCCAPELARTAASVVMLQRSPSYIYEIDNRAGALIRACQALYRSGLRAPVRLLRWYLQLRDDVIFVAFRAFPALARAIFRRHWREAVSEEAYREHFTPRYDPWQQRIPVAIGLKRALRDGRLALCTGEIERFTPGGMVLKDAREIACDVCILATGYELDLFRFGLSVDGAPVEVAGISFHKGIMMGGVPNYFHPFGAVHSAWTQSTEAMTRYAIDVMLRVRDEGRRGVCVPRRELWSAPRILPGYVQRSLSRLPRLYGNWGLPTLDNVLSYRFDARELRFS